MGKCLLWCTCRFACQIALATLTTFCVKLPIVKALSRSTPACNKLKTISDLRSLDTGAVMNKQYQNYIHLDTK